MGEIIFSYMPHAPSPAVAIQTATQVAHMGRSFCMFLRSILIGENVYTYKVRAGRAGRADVTDVVPPPRSLYSPV